MRGEAGDALNAVAYRLGCDGMARTLLRRGNRAERSLAMLILGHLRDGAAWKDLIGQAAAPDSATAIHALWALVKIDPAAATDHMTPFFIQSDDWSLSQIIVILQEAKDICAPVLLRALDGLDASRLPRALQPAEALEIELPEEVTGGLLQHADVGVVIATLRLVKNPAVLPQVRSRLADPDWRVRVQDSGPQRRTVRCGPPAQAAERPAVVGALPRRPVSRRAAVPEPPAAGAICRRSRGPLRTRHAAARACRTGGPPMSRMIIHFTTWFVLCYFSCSTPATFC